MTVYNLGQELKSMYENAPHGETTTFIRLFGIKYAEQIKRYDYKVTDIVKASGIGASYQAEVNKGVQLAKYVLMK